VSESVDLQITARLMSASNVTLQCIDTKTTQKFVYKPESGERPLWDFPLGTLTGRELAAFHIDKLLDWGLVPPTQWIEFGPSGPGMLQEWIEEVEIDRPVNIYEPNAVPPDWITILAAQDSDGRLVHLVHANNQSLKRMAALDAVLNNADRKAGHILIDADQRIFGIDHGVCFNAENKLRTVLWGWAGQPLDQEIVTDLTKLQNSLSDFYEPVDTWLADYESVALRDRIDHLLLTGTYPLPAPEWPAIPWPVF